MNDAQIPNYPIPNYPIPNYPIPNYPVVTVTVRPDGSAHLNAAGQHVDYPAGEIEVTRAEVITYAVTVAARLGRGVRMTTTDPDGEWKLGVYPDGKVVDLGPAPARARRARKPGPTSGPSTVTTVTTVTTVAALTTLSLPTSPTVVLEHAIDVTGPRSLVPLRVAPAGVPRATLTFSTGDVAIVGEPAIIGRDPQPFADPHAVQLVTVHDSTRNVSRVHAEVRWIGEELMLTDRGSGNGTAITRPPAAQFELQSEQPYRLLTGDLVHLGAVVTFRLTIGDLDLDFGSDGGPDEHM
jgi:hypothetical protein